MKKVLVISSTPREGGNSQLLAKSFAKGAQDSGNQVEFISLKDYKINYCIGCYACHTTGRCFQQDDMTTLANKLLDADVIVFSTPVYFYCMSGQLKVFIDRLVPVYTKVKADIYLFATAYDTDQNLLNNTLEAIRGLTRDCFEGCQEKGAMAVGGLDDAGEIEGRVELQQAYQMGKIC